jgi:hypothetical protein
VVVNREPRTVAVSGHHAGYVPNHECSFARNAALGDHPRSDETLETPPANAEANSVLLRA